VFSTFSTDFYTFFGGKAGKAGQMSAGNAQMPDLYPEAARVGMWLFTF
jgi:hypothetical protein